MTARSGVLGPRTGAARLGGLSVRVYWPAVLLGGLLTALASAVALVSLTLGDFELGVGEVVDALTGRAGVMVTHVVVEMRLPRVLTALGVGAALALSGALLQRLAHNPLVSPDVIGVSAGATTAAVLAIVVFGGTAAAIAASALAGAVATAFLLYLLAYRRGVSGQRLVLVGIAVTAMLGAVTSYLLTRTELTTAQRAMLWLTGSLANRDWPHVVTVALALAVLAPTTLLLARPLSLLQLGEDTATALGGRVRLARGALLFTSAALAATATAVAGPVAFVALVAPQIVRRLLGGRALGLLACAACGALLTAGADLVARTAFGGSELPVGVVTGVLGAPFLLYLLARGDSAGRGR
ncbi:iron chelate uptake ABC transporter family permease subunit [Nocardiopsis dassonvillei]|uniref:FecCD family ABC transporter permease n=1 Tax=Nocardiopsis dassonvillei TaxID=2014 RepID=UPI0020A5671E|nr:iron chelate uptake ABC transporter family permease subunit [Nocardiopsis dassonvillei]MCP3012780.1 iron chelate uptake ABC transporter family permease subunit [Nocardiopsis dassonvillei]